MIKVISNKIANRFRTGVNSEKGFVGKDGWFFLGNEFDRERDQALGIYPIDKVVIANWSQSLRYATDVLARRSIEIVFFITPAKWSVYRDKVSENEAQPVPPGTSFQQLKECLLNSRVNLIDSTDALKAARATAETYSPLNSHWTNFGGLVGWNEIAKGIRSTRPDIALPSLPALSRIEVLDGFNEAANIIGAKAPNPWARPVFEHDLPVYDYILPGYTKSPQRGEREIDLTELPVVTECATAPNDVRVLVLRDSTGNQISPFIQTGFRSVLQHKHNFEFENTYSNILGTAKLFNPELVIYVLTERYLIYSFLDVDYWEAANNFDLANAEFARVWPKEPDRPYLDFFPSNDPTIPSVLKVPDEQEHKVRYVNISVDCASSGRVCIWYVSEDQQFDTWFPVDCTRNELFLEIPGSRSVGALNIVSSSSGPIFTVNRIEIRSTMSVR